MTRRRWFEAVGVGGGLALIALSGYVVLALAGHVLDPAEYAAVGSLYLLVSILGPGIFAAVEQQANREVAARIAAGVGWGPVPRAAGGASARLAAVTTLGVVALAPVLLPRVFGGSWMLLGAAALGVWGAAASFPLRGGYAGQRRYGWYGACMGIEGLARVGLCAGLVWLGVRDGDGYGLVFGSALVISAAAALAGWRRGPDGPPFPHSRMSARVGVLAGGCALTLVLANLGPVVLASRLGAASPGDPDGAALAASFVSLFVLARVPVLLVTPLQAVLLPRFTAAVQRGAFDALRGQVRGALLAALAVGVPGVVIGALAGPRAAQVFFDAPLRLSWLVAGLLGVGTVFMVVAQLVGPALVALGRNRDATTAWGAGTAVFAVLLALPGTPLAACVAAQVAGPAVVAAAMLRALLFRTRPLVGTRPRAQTYTASTSMASHSTASTWSTRSPSAISSGSPPLPPSTSTA